LEVNDEERLDNCPPASAGPVRSDVGDRASDAPAADLPRLSRRAAGALDEAAAADVRAERVGCARMTPKPFPADSQPRVLQQLDVG
jgi:hypothetical protein